MCAFRGYVLAAQHPMVRRTRAWNGSRRQQVLQNFNMADAAMTPLSFPRLLFLSFAFLLVKKSATRVSNTGFIRGFSLSGGEKDGGDTRFLP